MLGGGPAGLAFAALAAQSGASVLVVERFGYDTPRPGEHLPGGVRGALAGLGVPLPKDLTVVRQSAGIISSWGSTLPEVKSYSQSNGAALNVDRAAFDAMLLEHAISAGVSASLGTKLTSAERRTGSWQILLEAAGKHRTIKTDWVVDATGRNSVFARRQNSQKSTAGDLVAVATWFELNAEYDVPAAALFVNSIPIGWWSLAQTPAGMAVSCFYSSRYLMRHKKTRPKDWAWKALADTPQIASRLIEAKALATSSRTFACAPALLNPPYGDGWIAIGDAAAAYDPICGHGSQYALESAFRAFELVSANAPPKIAPLYAEALKQKMTDHLDKRRDIYHDADMFDPQFLEKAVWPTLARRANTRDS